MWINFHLLLCLYNQLYNLKFGEREGGQRVFGQAPPHCPVISLTRCNRPDRKGRSDSPNNATFTLSGKFAFISKLFPWQRTLLCLKPYVHCRNCNNNGVNKWIDSIILFVLFNFLLFRKNKTKLSTKFNFPKYVCQKYLGQIFIVLETFVVPRQFQNSNWKRYRVATIYFNCGFDKISKTDRQWRLNLLWKTYC